MIPVGGILEDLKAPSIVSPTHHSLRQGGSEWTMENGPKSGSFLSKPISNVLAVICKMINP